MINEQRCRLGPVIFRIIMLLIWFDVQILYDISMYSQLKCSQQFITAMRLHERWQEKCKFSTREIRYNHICLAFSFTESWPIINIYLWCNYFFNQYSSYLFHIIEHMGPHQIVYHILNISGDAIFFHSNLLHHSSANRSDMRRWAYLISYNTKSNDPVIEHHHASYIPLDKV